VVYTKEGFFRGVGRTVSRLVFVEEVVFEVRTNAVRDHSFKHFRDKR